MPSKRPSVCDTTRTVLARVSAVAFALSTALVLSGCTAFERGADQGEPVVHAVTGCPDLSGTFALQPFDEDGNPDGLPDPRKRAAVEGALFSPKTEAAAGIGFLGHYSGVTIRHLDTHAIEFQFARAHGNVTAALEQIREYERPRYAEWYSLMQDEGRERYIARRGEPARATRLAELGPETMSTVTLERDRDYTCADGWVLFPRSGREPVRMTLDPAGHIVFESKELNTYDIPVWCGDGCKTLDIPTGAYLGTEHWPRDASARPWNPDDASRGFVFLPPAEVAEAEQKAFAENNRRSAERRFATPDQVREALTPLLNDGVEIETVEISSLPFKGARMRVHVVPADAAMPSEDQQARQEWFLAALREGDSGYIEDSEVIKRGIVSGGSRRHEMEIFLDTHPAVQPMRVPEVESGTASTVAVTYIPPPALPQSATTDESTASVADAPAGIASMGVLRTRLDALVAGGCRFDALSFVGRSVRVIGRADRMQCVSDSMRAIDGAVPDATSGIQLVEIRADEGGYRFELLLPESALTKA